MWLFGFAVTVIFPLPSKDTPLIVRGVWSRVAVLEFPEQVAARVAVAALPEQARAFEAWVAVAELPVQEPEEPLTLPVMLAVIVPAEKLPLPSRATMALGVFVLAAVVAELETLPGVAMVASLVSTMAAPAAISELTMPDMVASSTRALSLAGVTVSPERNVRPLVIVAMKF